MKAESLIFDIDGTLWDTRALVAEGYNVQLRKEGLEHLCVDADILTPLFGKVLEDIADILFAGIPVPERYQLTKRCMDAEQKYLWTVPCDVGYPRVKETLEELAKRYRLFIVSNSEQGYPQLCVEKMGLGHLIQAHLCYGDTLTSKGQTILRLMRENGIKSAVYIGDTQSDYLATREAGIPFIFASYGLGQAEAWEEKINQIEDLLKFL